MKMIYIENEGALFKGQSIPWPEQVWSARQGKFIPYQGDVPKRQGWGEEISEAEARSMMAVPA